MGFINVLKFSAACFDLLGWPLFALGYPLCASIWVIETNSISDIRKLVTYWVLFSLVSLFDHAFGKLLEWVPFWPYIKLMIICFLVIPHFDGACYVYRHLVHPCLSMDPQVVMTWFLNESKKSFHGREKFLVAADRYVKENGAEALEKLLATKVKSSRPKAEVKDIKACTAAEIKGEQWKCEDPTVAQKEIQVVQPTQIKNGKDRVSEGPDVTKEIKVTEVTLSAFDAAAHWVNRTDINLGETRRDTACAAQMKERTTAVAAAEIEACRDHTTPEILVHKEVQKEWACAMCQVTTQSEATLNFHLQGKRHKATADQLKAKKNGTPAAPTTKKPDDTKDEDQQTCASGNRQNNKNNKKQEKAQVVPDEKEWGCAMCQVTTQSKATLNSHLRGKRHKATADQLKAKKNGTSAASTTKKPDDTTDDNQSTCASSNGLNQENNKKQEKAQVPDSNEHGHQKNSKQARNELNELGSWCNICNVTCTSEQNMASHLNGKKHFNRIKQLSELWCSNCNVKCQSEVHMASHKNGKRHLEQLKEQSELWCSICSLNCSSKMQMDSHLNGRRHLEQIEEQLKSWCSACNVLCKSELSMAFHLKERRHLEKMSNT